VSVILPPWVREALLDIPEVVTATKDPPTTPVTFGTQRQPLPRGLIHTARGTERLSALAARPFRLTHSTAETIGHDVLYSH